MNKIFNFNSRVLSAFENDVENIREFAKIARCGANRDYSKYSFEDTNTILRNGFDKILGINFKEADAKTRRQSWRANKHAVYTIIEDILVDRMTDGWGTEPFFLQFLEEKNMALGDMNEFYVNDNSLLQVSKFAGNHHDIVRQKVGPGRSFRVETSWYVIKIYNDFELFQAGKIDFAAAIDKMYKSIDNYRNAAVLDAFYRLHDVLPTDLKLTVQLSESTIADIVECAEAVATASGYDVTLVGSKVALNKLAKTVSYDVWSEKMKDEQNQNGCLGHWEGFTLMPLPRVHIPGGFTSAIDNNAIYIIPNDPEFKPIKRVTEGDVMFYESGMDGMKKDMTIDAEIAYKEGIGIVINQAYGYIEIEQ